MAFVQGTPDRPRNGELFNSASTEHVADSVNVVDGTVSSGSVVDTRTLNEVYLVVNESGKFEIEFSFSGLVGIPAVLIFAGRYEGNPSHDVFLEQWNYDSSTWVRTTAALNDFPSAASDYNLSFNLIRSADYLSGGAAKVRFRHDTAAVGSHDFFTDLVCVAESNLELVAKGVSYKLGNFEEGLSRNVTVDAAAGTYEIVKDGEYRISSFLSFEGTSDATFVGAVYVDGVEARKIWDRKIDSDNDLGSSSGNAKLDLSAGEVVDLRVSCDVDDAFVTIHSGAFSIEQTG